jgi:hypothetical protein
MYPIAEETGVSIPEGQFYLKIEAIALNSTESQYNSRAISLSISTTELI